MKRTIYFLILFISLLKTSFGQLSISLNVDPNPSPKVIEWALNTQIVTLTVTNLSSNIVSYKIKAQLFKDGELIGETRLESMSPLSIDANTTDLFYVEDVIPERALKYYGSIEKTILKTNKLPAGNYKLCVKLLNVPGSIQLTNETCQPFVITSYQQPRLILPFDATEVQYTSTVPNIVFQWSPVLPQPSFAVVYKLRVVVKSNNQTKLNAFRYNTSIFESEVTNTTSQMWPIESLTIEPDKTYVWAVISEDQDGTPIGENEGLSEIWEFRIVESLGITSKTSEAQNQTSDKCDYEIKNINLSFSQKAYPQDASFFNGCNISYKVDDNVFGLNNEPRPIGSKKKIDKYTIGKRVVTHKILDGNCQTATFSIDDKLVSSNHVPVDINVESCKIKKLGTFNQNNDKKTKANIQEYEDITFDFEVTCSTDCYLNGNYLCASTKTKVFTYSNGYVKEQGAIIIADCNSSDEIISEKDNINRLKYKFSNKESITLTGESTNFNWDFGDGQNDNTKNPIHIYTKAGTYEVTMKVEHKKTNGEVCIYTKKKKIYIIADCNDSACNFDNSTVFQGNFVNGDSIYLCGNLRMFFAGSTVTKNSDNSFSGTGIIYIPWLLTGVNVGFDKIKVNNSFELIEGEINAIRSANCPNFPTQWAINAGYHLTQEQINNLNDFVNDKIIDREEELKKLGIPSPDQDILLNTIKEKVVPVNVPLGFRIKDKDRPQSSATTIAISSIRFTPNQNYIKASAQITPLRNMDSFKLVFETNNFFFNAKGPILNNGGVNFSFDLLSRKTLIYTGLRGNLMKIIINPKDNTHIGTSIFINSQCNKPLNWCFSLDADIEFPRDWLIPFPDNGSSVFLHTEQELCNWDDYFIELNLPKCEIANTNGFLIETNTLVWDQSDVRNPDNIVFPTNFKGNKDELFEGFWMKSSKVIFPDGFRTFDDPNKDITVDLNNWIFEKKYGITGELIGSNLRNFPSLNVSDLGASIDTFKLIIDRSEFSSAYIKGYITLPICDYDSSISSKAVNKLEYKALLNSVSESNNNIFTFVVNPLNKYNCEFLANGRIELKNTSNIKIVVAENGSKSFDLTLNGKLDFPDKKLKLGNLINYDFEMEAAFDQMKFSYQKQANQNGYGSFNEGNWSFASPQKKFHKFPITINNFKGISRSFNLSQNKIIQGGLGFDMVLNLDSIIGGKANIALIGTIEKKQTGRLSAKFDSIEISKVDVYANLAAIQISGGLVIRNNDPTYGNGFGGYLSANFKTLNTTIDANAQFGNTNYQNGNQLYRYWQVSALAIAPPPGIPLTPGLAIRGAGLGAYKNMTNNLSNKVIDLTKASSKDVGANFTPLKSSWGFDVKAVLASSPNEEAANGDVIVGAQFSGTGGITQLNFGGDIYIGCQISKRSDALMNGQLRIDYDFTQKVFACNVITNFNKDPISTPNGLSLNIYSDGKNDKWSVKFGTPNNPNSVKVLGASSYSYLMFGNDIPKINDFTYSFKSSYKDAIGYDPASSSELFSANNSNTETGKGFAFGVGVKKNVNTVENNLSGGDENDGFRPNLLIDISAGGEFNISMYKYNGGCGIYNPIGINGYYCKGSIGFYAKFDIGINFRKKGKSCTDEYCLLYCCKNWKGESKYPNGFSTYLVSVHAGASIVGGFPNPVYLYGTASASVDFAGFSKSFNVNFNLGNQCSNNATTPNLPNLQENATEKINKNLIRSISVPSGLGFDYRKPINVEYSYPIAGFLFNNSGSQVMGSAPFDVSERQLDGSVKVRTFYVLYHYQFKRQIPNGTLKEFPLKHVVNSLGTYDYYDNTVNTSLTTLYDENGWPIPAQPLRNKFVHSTRYIFKCSAALYEVGENGQATIAKDKNNNEIVEIKEIDFTTIPFIQESSSAISSSPIIINSTGTSNSNLNSTSNQNNNGN